ncbi:MAG: M56 family metallopeptidase [Planctomycetia bacterium]|nr:M56 family metallopeptidase [Planctomycetia bacterium]
MSFDGDLLDLWGAAMWRASWQGGLAALVVAFMCRLRPSIPARYQCWMWRLVMLKFAVAFVWSVPVEIPVLPSADPIVSAAVDSPIPFSHMSSDDTPTVDERSPSNVPLLLIPFATWAVIVAWQLGRILVSCRNARLLKNRCRASEDRQLLDPCSRLSAMLGLRSPPLVLETEGQGSPLLVGILRPAIVLPTTTLERLDASERSLVLGHELAHVSRRDLFCSLVSAMIRALFFFHPAAWFSERRLGLTQEIAADQLAISLQNQSPVHYAQILLAIVGKLGSGRTAHMMSMGAAGEAGSLYRRLSAMRYVQRTTPGVVLAYGLLIGFGAMLGLVPWSLVAAPAAAAEETKPTERKEQSEAIVNGRYVSFQEGVLKVKVRDDQSDVETEREWNVAEDVNVVSHHRAGPKQSIARDAFKQWEPGGLIAVTLNDGNVVFIKLGTDKVRVPKSVRSRESSLEKKVDHRIDANSKMHWGRFTSFKNGTLTLESNSGELIETNVVRKTKTTEWSDTSGKFVPTDTFVALRQLKVGTVIVVNGANQSGTLRIGSRKGVTIGTFVSYENDRLLMLGKNLGERFTKKYGNNVHFNKFRDDVPAYESIDGGEYRPIGMANEALRNVKEGTILHVHSEGDDNITLVRIGEKK